MLFGNPSGNSITTDINNHSNMYYMRYAYIILVEEDLYNYNNRVASGFQGDDNITAIARCIGDKYNMVTISAVLKDIGVNMTNADKSSIDVPFHTWDQVTFLKRNFVHDEKFDLVLAPLQMSSIMEIARWSESDPLNIEDQTARFNATLLFLSSHSRDKFEQMRRSFISYIDLLKQGKCTVDGKRLILNYDSTKLFTWDRCKQINYPEYYKLSSDLAEVLGKKHEVMLSFGSD